MAWFSKDGLDVPEELKGKSPDEILAAVKEGDSLKEKVGSLESDLKAKEDDLKSRDSQLSGLGTEVQQLKDDISKLEASPGGNGNDQGGGNDKGPTSVLVDEDQAFNERMAPVAQLAVQAGALAAENVARQKIEAAGEGKMYGKFEKEINEVLKNVKPAQRVYVETYTNAFNLVKGRHMGDILESTKKGDGQFFVEPVGGPAPSGVDGGDDDKDKITKEEAVIAKKMGVSSESYLKTKKEMNYVAG